MLFEVLNFLFVLLGPVEAWEGAKVPPLPCRLVFLARIQSIFTGLQFANHIAMDARGRHCVAPTRWPADSPDGNSRAAEPDNLSEL